MTEMKLRKRMDMGGDTMAMTSDECRANDPVWLQSMSYCVRDRCTREGVSDSRQGQCFVKIAANGQPVPSLQEALPEQAPAVEVTDKDLWLNTTKLVNSELWAANRRTLAEFEFSEEMHTQYSLIVYLVTMGICLAMAALTFFSYPASSSPKTTSTSSRYIRKIKQYLILPALFGGRHLEPLRWNIGYVPGRALTVFISIYVILNIVFCCISYHLASPNTWFSEDRDQIAGYVGNRTGVLGFTNLGIAILFAGRNNILITLTGWSQTTSLTFHRWAARVATLQAVVHSVIYTVTYFWDGGAAAYYAEASLPYYWWGIIATTALGVMIGLAFLPIRLRAYELFLITHIALAILALIGCWYHVDILFNKRWGYEVWLYLCFAFWSFDRVARLVKLGLFNNWTGSTKAHVTRIPNTDIVQLTLFPGRFWESAVGPGQHSFLYFPSTGKVWETHPFTIADWGTMREQAKATSDNSLSEGTSLSEKTPTEIPSTGQVQESGPSPKQRPLPNDSTSQAPYSSQFYLRFLLRVQTGSTRSLIRQLETSARGTPLSQHLTILTEGPYAGHKQTLHPLFTADTVLCIAGGIGITFPLGFVKHYVSLDFSSPKGGNSSAQRRTLMGRTTRFVLAWSAREDGLIRHVTETILLGQHFHRETGARTVDVRIWHTGTTYTSSATTESQAEDGKEKEIRLTVSPSGPVSITRGTRMPIASVLDSVLEPSHRITVLVCAPGGMADAVRKEVVRAISQGFDVDLLEEAFAW
ncbi:uncharacterized protein Z518_06081 [Rhinocladiella mackenziei CBS 650.93]|uniref:FAD-binding FR-type domain-containing protein n=1 Tax=Rhinocladiella mackenziei CBS 650.93 TaxID=1442369 RepID=A0A0D2IHE4_9EURO|nr:uncharacterized protein Z518_06081 [Rhinocladiella mackenziei CBS 650.93]KIX05209.1 hypothetical protein Z518_06081 [Rhinocladiella mackenziei CBS 650.93]